MVGASGGLILILGIGSVLGPIVVGLALTLIGPDGFFWWLAANLAGLAAFALWRTSRRAALPDEQQAPYVPAPLQGSELSATAAQEAAAEMPSPDGPGPGHATVSALRIRPVRSPRSLRPLCSAIP